MSLADYEPVREVVTLPRGGSMHVRGLSLEDFATLFRAHLTDLEAVVHIFAQNQTPETAGQQVIKHGIGIVRDAPALATTLIALAIDEPDHCEKVRKLPLAVQMMAIEKIAKLTFEEAGGPKKFVEGLASLLQGLAPPLR